MKIASPGLEIEQPCMPPFGRFLWQLPMEDAIVQVVLQLACGLFCCKEHCEAESYEEDLQGIRQCDEPLCCIPLLCMAQVNLKTWLSTINKLL